MEAVHLFPEHELVGTEIDYGFMHQYRQVSCLPDFTSQSMEMASIDELHPSYPTLLNEKRPPNKHQKTDPIKISPETCLSSPHPRSHTSGILSFGAPGGDLDHLLVYGKPKPKEEAEYPDVKAHAYQRNKRPYSSMTKVNSMEDHVMAERKRREKLSQHLIALSAVLPGLKKMDKATILAEAIKYVKELQERVDVLEERTKKRKMESITLVRKSHVSRTTGATSSSNSEDSCLSDEQSTGSRLPEVEVRISDKDVLIRIHCEKQKGTLSNILNEIETLHLTVTNSSVVPFGNSILDITVISLMEKDLSMNVKDLVNHLTHAFSKFM